MENESVCRSLPTDLKRSTLWSTLTFPKVSLSPHDVGHRRINLIRDHCCASGHFCTNNIRVHFCIPTIRQPVPILCNSDPRSRHTAYVTLERKQHLITTKIQVIIMGSRLEAADLWGWSRHLPEVICLPGSSPSPSKAATRQAYTVHNFSYGNFYWGP
jgi:hypothetical protein